MARKMTQQPQRHQGHLLTGSGHSACGAAVRGAGGGPIGGGGAAGLSCHPGYRAGAIGLHLLAALLPARRLRVRPRIVKRAISKYQARGPSIDRTSYKAIIGIDILAPPQALTATTNT